MGTYRITRWRRTPEGEAWLPVKCGLTRERAERLVEGAKWDLRLALSRLRVEEEN